MNPEKPVSWDQVYPKFKKCAICNKDSLQGYYYLDNIICNSCFQHAPHKDIYIPIPPLVVDSRYIGSVWERAQCDGGNPCSHLFFFHMRQFMDPEQEKLYFKCAKSTNPKDLAPYGTVNGTVNGTLNGNKYVFEEFKSIYTESQQLKFVVNGVQAAQFMLCKGFVPVGHFSQYTKQVPLLKAGDVIPVAAGLSFLLHDKYKDPRPHILFHK